MNELRLMFCKRYVLSLPELLRYFACGAGAGNGCGGTSCCGG